MSANNHYNYHYPSSHNGAQEYGSRPLTPGSFAMSTSSLGKYHDNGSFAAQYDPADPHSRSYSPSPLHAHETGDATYYFSKEGGAATAAGAGATAGAAAAARGAGDGAKRGGFWGWVKRHPVWSVVIVLLIVAAAVGAAVGGVVASTHSNSDTSNPAQHDSTSGGKTGGSGSSSASGTATSAAPPAASSIVPLPKWKLTDPQSRMVGVSLGNWLAIERWIDEDWFTQTAGDNTWDEWTFSQNLGPEKGPAALQQHWNTWITEADFDTMKSVGINTVRIPVGYWAFVDTIQNEPYFAKSGQTEQLQKVFGWLHDRGMYAMIDLHGMPGSQSGDQASGHNTSDVNWWQDAYFGYSYTVLNATIAFIQQSNYSSVVHSICPVNEPMVKSSSSKMAQLTSYYENAYQIIKNAGLIMMFHHGFTSDPFNDWRSFASGKDPNYLAFNSNPYFGWFPPNSDSDGIMNNVCDQAQQASNFPVPVIMTEYSVANGVGSKAFTKAYYNSQVSAWAWSGGSMFWTWKTVHSSNPVLANGPNAMDQFSLSTMIQQGVVQTVDASQSPLGVIKQLPNQQCGNIPTVTWSNPSGNTRSS